MSDTFRARPRIIPNLLKYRHPCPIPHPEVSVPLRPFVAAFLLAAAPLALEAQTLPAPAPADAQAMLAALEDSRIAFNTGDFARHVAVYVDSVTFMTANGPRPGTAPIIRSFEQAYKVNGVVVQQLTFESVTIRALGPDHALMNGRFRLAAGGGRQPATGWFTLIWQRTAAGWKAVHDHSS